MESYRYEKDSYGRQVRKDVQEIFDVLEKWYDKLQNGTAALTIADPFFIVPKNVTEVIEVIDKDFEDHEAWRLSRYHNFPNFKRLNSSAKMAMVQELHKRFSYQLENAAAYLIEYKAKKSR